jgi:hypothetical protein
MHRDGAIKGAGDPEARFYAAVLHTFGGTYVGSTKETGDTGRYIPTKEQRVVVPPGLTAKQRMSSSRMISIHSMRNKRPPWHLPFRPSKTSHTLPMSAEPHPTEPELSEMIRDMWRRDIVKLQQLLKDNPAPADARRYRDNIQVLMDWLQEEHLFH